METLPNEIIEHIYHNLNANDSAKLSLASKVINECRPDYSYEKHKVLFARTLAEIVNIKYLIVGKQIHPFRHEYKFGGYFGPGAIKCVCEPSIYSIREINGRTTATATFADTMKTKTDYDSEFNFRYTVEIYSNIKSSGEQKIQCQRATWKIQNVIAKFFREDDFVYVYSYTDTQKLIIDN
jgi:hypothetical protein